MLALNVLMRGVATDRSTRRQGLRSHELTTAGDRHDSDLHEFW